MSMPSPGRTAVYRLSGLENRLLYVGITTNPLQRWANHASTQEWWPDVAVREIEWFATRAEAETAEAKAIDEDAPKWNKRAGRDHTVRGPAGRCWRPDAAFADLVEKFERAERAAISARRDLELAIVREFVAGASSNAIARHVPWDGRAILALAKSHGVPKLRQPTVGRLVTHKD